MKDEQATVVAAIPGGGWTFTVKFDDGTEETWPVLAWLVYADGDVEAVNVDGEGLSNKIISYDNLVSINPPGMKKKSPLVAL